MAKILQNKIINKIINSGFQVSQRGTSSSANGYLVDRFAFTGLGGGGTAAAFTQSQQIMPVGGDSAFKIQPTHFFRLTNTTIGTSLGVSSAHYLQQPIEDVNTVKAGINTLSFYARSTISNKQINVGLFQSFGSGGSTAVTIAGQTITLTSSWRRYVIPFNVPSIAGKTVGINSAVTALLYLQQGSTDAANYGLSGIAFGGTGDTDVTQMQFNEGGLIDYAPQGTSIGHELALCQRYCEVIGGNNNTILGTGYSINTTTAQLPFLYKVFKRAVPTITVSSVTSFRYNNATNNYTASNFVSAANTQSSCSFILTTSGIVSGNIPGVFDTLGTAIVTIDSEL